MPIWDYEEFLLQLIEAEVLTRRAVAVARLLRQARFPDLKTLEQLDWDALRGVERPQLAQLATCAYIERAEDVVIAGPIGTGKTHLAIALGVEAARRRHRVAFVRAADLVRELVEARDELTLSRLHQRYLRVALLIVDELGFVPFERAGGELLCPQRRRTTPGPGRSPVNLPQASAGMGRTVETFLAHPRRRLGASGWSFATLGYPPAGIPGDVLIAVALTTGRPGTYRSGAPSSSTMATRGT